MTCEFLSGLIQLPFSSTDVVVGAGGLPAGTLYLFLTGRNRAGWTIASSPVTVNHPANSSITIDLPATARGLGTDFHRYSLSANTTNDPISSYQLAEWENYEADQYTRRTLDPIVLTLPAHIANAPSVAIPADLPTGSNLINGQHRLIIGGLPNSAASSYYKYAEYETRPANLEFIIEPHVGEKWVRVANPYTGQITDPYAVGGCAADVREIDLDYVLAPPLYDPVQLNPVKGTPIYLAWRNDSTIALSAGTNLGLEIRQGLENRTDAFNGKLILTLRGYTDGFGGFDRLDAGGIDAMPNVDVDRVWGYADDALGILTLDKDLPAGESVVYEIAPYFTAQQFQGKLAANELISIYLYPYAQSGKNVNALWAITGDLVLSVADRMHVTPAIGAGVNIGAGSAIVKGYTFTTVPAQTVYGLSLNTRDQKLCLDGNGVCSIRSTPLTSEAIRAIVGTESGAGAIGAISASVAIAASGAANLVVTYPGYTDGLCTIRSDYPIVGGDLGEFNPNFVRIYAQLGSTVYPARSGGITDIPIIPGVTQAIVIDSIGSSVAMPTSPTDPLFGLFSPPTIAVTPTTGGTIPAGSYQFFALYYYDGSTVSKIDCTHPDVIRESELTIADLYLLNQGWGRPIYDLADLRSIDRSDTFAWQHRPVIGGSIFYYDPTSLATDNNLSVFKPSYLSNTQAGRWHLRVDGSSGGSGLPAWIEVESSASPYNVAATGGRFSIDAGGGLFDLILPLNPATHTEVTYQIVDSTSNPVLITPQIPNTLSDELVSWRGKHNPATLRSAIETVRFVGNRWIPAFDRLIYESTAIEFLAEALLVFEAVASIAPMPFLLAEASLVFEAVASIAPVSFLATEASLVFEAIAPITPVQILNITVSPTTQAEDSGSPFTFTITRNSTSESVNPLTVNLAVSGTATFATDYTQSGAATFTTTTASVVILANQLSADITITPSADGTTESDETIVLTIVPSAGVSHFGTNSAATATIINDDGSIDPLEAFRVVNINCDSGTIVDAKGHSITINGSAAASSVQKRAGTHSILLTGGNLDVAGGSDFNFGTSPYSIHVAARFTTIGTNNTTFSPDNQYVWDFDGADTSALFYTARVAFPGFNVSNAAAVRINYNLTPIINTWYDWALAKIDNKYLLILNNQIVGADNTAPTTANLSTLRLGGVATAATANFQGYLDSVSIYKGVASGSTMSHSYPSRFLAAFGNSPNDDLGAIGTIVGTTHTYDTTNKRSLPTSALFVGAGHISYPQIANYNLGAVGFEIAGWLKIATGTQNSIAGILSIGSDTGVFDNQTVKVLSSATGSTSVTGRSCTNKLSVWIGAISTSNAVLCSSTTLDDNAPHYWRIIKYIIGASAATVLIIDDRIEDVYIGAYTIATTTRDLLLGSDGFSTARRFIGNLDDIAIYRN